MMKNNNARAVQSLLAGLLALPLLLGGAVTQASEMGPEAVHGPRPLPSAGPDAGPAFGPIGRGHQGHLPPPMFGAESGPRPPLLQGLELSEAQQDKVFALLHAEAPYLHEQHKAATKAEEALRALGHAEQFDDAKATALAKELASATANIALQRVRTEQKLLAILSPEQRKKLAERPVPPKHRP